MLVLVLGLELEQRISTAHCPQETGEHWVVRAIHKEGQKMLAQPGDPEETGVSAGVPGLQSPNSTSPAVKGSPEIGIPRMHVIVGLSQHLRGQ